VCRIGCGGVPMRVYNRPMSGGSWNTLEEYLDAPTVQWYGVGANSYSDYSLLDSIVVRFLRLAQSVSRLRKWDVRRCVATLRIISTLKIVLLLVNITKPTLTA